MRQSRPQLSAQSDRLKPYHFKHEFADTNCRFFCLSYFAREFKQLRNAVFGSADEATHMEFVRAMSRY